MAIAPSFEIEMHYSFMERTANGFSPTPNELLNWIAKEVTRFAERKTRAIFVNQLTWC